MWHKVESNTKESLFSKHQNFVSVNIQFDVQVTNRVPSIFLAGGRVRQALTAITAKMARVIRAVMRKIGG